MKDNLFGEDLRAGAVETERFQELTHEAIYNTRIKKLLVYHLIDGEVVDDTIEDFGNRTFQITKDHLGNCLFEFIDEDGGQRSYPLIQIDD